MRVLSFGQWWLQASYVFVFALALVLCIRNAHQTAAGGGRKTYFIYWNTSSSMFRIDNTDHIFDINKGNSKFEYDQIDIICPQYQREEKDEDTEKYIIYNVSKEEYETCRITNPNPRIIAVCDKPYKIMYFTITFRPFTPQPGGLEFLGGHDYYFISTSSRDDLHRRIGGRCTTHNMKVMFKVWSPIDSDPVTTTTASIPVVTVPNVSWLPAASPSNVSHSILETEFTEKPTQHTSTVASVNTPRVTKKVKPYDKHPNDIEKSSLTRSAGVALQPLVLLVSLSFSLGAFRVR